MGNTNFNTVIQMPNIVNDLVKQAVGREAVSTIDMNYVTVAQNQKEVNRSVDFTPSADFENNNELPMVINVKIVPVQEGTGDPSSENIRPITGFTSANVIDDPDYGGFITWNQGFKAYARGTVNGITFGSANNAKDQTLTGTATDTAYNRLETSVQSITDHVYYVDKHDPTNNSKIIIYNDNNMGVTTGGANATIGKALGNRYFYIRVNTGAVIDNLTITPQIFDLTLIFGSTIADYILSLEQATAGAGIAYFKKIFPKDYYAYDSGTQTTAGTVNGNTVRSEEIVFPDPPETVYGGSLNINTGVLTVTMGEIASYNGETLPGVWMSDRDVYAAGTTPSEGAQVVYELAEPVTYQCEPEVIKSLIGNNHVFADTGDVSVSYTSYIPVI